MSQWKDVKLGDVLTFANGKKIEECDRSLSGKNKIYGSNGVIGYTDKYLVDGETIIIGRVGAFCGSLEYSNQPVWVTDNAIYAKAKEGYDSKFIFLLLSTLNLRQFAGGSAQPLLNQTILKNISVKIPQLQVQEEISSVIFSLTDKIQLNLQMNQTLEEMALTLYKHWFVDFGPFQDGEFVESELGMIPKGWTIHKYSDLLDSYIGGDWGKDEPNEIENVEVGVIRGADFDKLSNGEFGNIPKRFIKTNSFDKRRMMERDIIIENSVNSSTRCVGKSFIVTKELINILGTNLICASFCKLFRLKEKKFASLAYLHLNYLYDTGKMEDYQNVSSNGIGNFQAKEFVKMEGIPMPNDFKQIKDIIDTFNNIIDQISLNRSEVFQLSSLRDYLLPRLLSGEIDLSQAEKQVEEVL